MYYDREAQLLALLNLHYPEWRSWGFQDIFEAALELGIEEDDDTGYFTELRFDDDE